MRTLQWKEKQGRRPKRWLATSCLQPSPVGISLTNAYFFYDGLHKNWVLGGLIGLDKKIR